MRIWKLSLDLIIYNCHIVYRETNKTADYLTKKCIDIIDLRTWWLNFSKNIININFKDYYNRPVTRFVKLRPCSSL